MPTLNRRYSEPPPRRDPFRAIYQSDRWHRYSRLFRKHHPLCALCLKEGKTVPSECVDHKIPMMQGGPIWEPANHQALCNKCHSKKTKAEQ